MNANKTLLALAALTAVAAVTDGCAATRATADDPRLSRNDMNLSVDPGVDFYEYANGGWLARNSIPAEESSWGVPHAIRDRNQELLREILEEAAADKSAPADSVKRKLGDFYASGMDTAEIEKQGAGPLHPWLVEIDAIVGLNGLDGLLAVLPRLHAIGVGALFGITPIPDFDDSTHVMAFFSQDGMGLPERDYYFRRDEESGKLRQSYLEHVGRMFELLGEDEETAAARALVVMHVETALADNAFRAVQFRNPQLLKNRVTVTEAQALMPSFDWKGYLKAVGLARVDVLNLTAPDYFARLSGLLTETSIADWKTYLRWRLIDAYASSLSSDFVEERFAFRGTVLSGTREMQPRWRRVMAATSAALGEALGQEYVARAFEPEAKVRAEAMVQDLIAAFRSRLAVLGWMSAETREEALRKLDAMGVKIGYPDEWRDYSGLELTRDSFATNRMRARSFEFHYELAKIGKETDRDEWGMTPQTVNAYYDPTRNEIVFPAGILQPPLFSADVDDAVNYGAMGAIIGHEITHGFDDTGNQFDASGDLANWWTEEDRAEFERRAQVVGQYAAYVAIGDLHVNGELTLGENIADLGGVTIAYDGLQKALADQPTDPIDGFTPEQRFFLSYARAWRIHYRPEALKLQVNSNPHAPGRFRAFGPLSNMPQFAAAFGLSQDAPIMRPESERVSIW